MLLCSSKIPVSESCTPDVFVGQAIEWVLGSKNYSFDPFSWDQTSEYVKFGNDGEVFQVGQFENNTICAIHFSATDNRSITWTTDFILDVEKSVLAFQLYREAPSNASFIPKAFSLPYLVNKLIVAGYAGLDSELKISSKPRKIGIRDIDWVTSIMLRQKEYNLPIVYLSCMSNGMCVVNPYNLAEKLNGVAHVLFEGDREISYSLCDSTQSQNPYMGAIQIYYPNGSSRILPSQLTGTEGIKVHAVVNAVFNHLNQLRVEDRFSWSQLQSTKLRSQLRLTIEKKEEDSKNYNDLEQMYEQLLSEKDSQIKRLNDQLFSANATNEQLELRLSSLANTPVLVIGEEQDLYPLEQQALLLEILEKELSNVKSCSRKAHIIASLLNANRCDNTVEEKRVRIKTCLHGYSKFTNAMKKEMEDIGFSLSDDGKHVKAVFGDDNRYMATLSKTGSDHRAGDNIAHDIINKIF